MKKGFFFLVLLAVTRAFAAPLAEFTVQPSGASVYVNGERRGAALPTLQLTDLRAGETYRLRFEADGYETAYRYFKMDPAGGALMVALNPETGLLLVASDPSGATIRDETGSVLGQTPRLVTTLSAKDPHTLTLSKLGYQDAKIRFAFDGRRPQLQNVTLTIDSGTLEVATVPAGATVTINGVDAGASPVKATGVRRGRAVVTAAHPGYRTATKTVDVTAGDNVPVTLELAPIPGKLSLSSVPEGARFYLESSPKNPKANDPLGSEPVVVCDGLAAGTYRIRAEMKGHATLTRDIPIGPGADVKEEFRLASTMGLIEFQTKPAGARVYVDGKKVGETVSSNPRKALSDPLLLRNVLAGEHDVRVECAGYATWTGTVTVHATETTPQRITLTKVFTPNLRVYLADEVIEGVLVSNGDRLLTIEVLSDPKRGSTINRTIPRELILKEEAIFAP